MTDQITLPSTSSFTPTAGLSSELRDRVHGALLSSPALPILQTELSSQLQLVGWLGKVQDRALQLLRSGQCSGFAETMEQICSEARGNIVEDVEDVEGDETDTKKKVDVKIPNNVVTHGIEIVKTVLEVAVKVVD